MKDIKFLISGILIIVSFFIGYYYKEQEIKNSSETLQNHEK